MKKYVKSNYTTFGICPSCKYYWEDYSVGDAECKQADNMTEDEFEKYFVDEQPGCPFYEEAYDPDEEAYINSFLDNQDMISSAQSISDMIIPYYTDSKFGGLVVNKHDKTENLDSLMRQFATVQGDTNSNYCVLLRQSNISSTDYVKLYFSNSLSECLRVAKDWVDGTDEYEGYSSKTEAWLQNHHYYADVIDMDIHKAIYYGDRWEDGTKGWIYKL